MTRRSPQWGPDRPLPIIFTDLDGTFLDASTYSYSILQDVLTSIDREGVPLVFCSSKTRPEIETLRQACGNRHPFIVENGGAVYWPEGYFRQLDEDTPQRDGYRYVELGTPRPQLLAVLHRVRTELGVPLRSFADMTAADLAQSAGLGLEESRRALRREYDEPFEILAADDALREQVIRHIEQHGLHCTQGGRYWHILGDNDKGKACRVLMSLYESNRGRLATIALGDSLNDLPMLRQVDWPVLVRREDGTHDPAIVEALPGVHLAEGIGPAGWKEAVTRFLGGAAKGVVSTGTGEG